MEKRSLYRYVFADAGGALEAHAPTGQQQLFEYQQQKLWLYETEQELEVRHQARRIFWKHAQSTEELAQARAFVWPQTQRIAMTLLLQPDPELIQAYIEQHRPENMWPQILQNMDTMGIRDMELYLQGDRAFLIMDVPEGFDLAQAGPTWEQLPREREWQQHVARFQKTDTQGKIEEKWQLMSPIL